MIAFKFGIVGVSNVIVSLKRFEIQLLQAKTSQYLRDDEDEGEIKQVHIKMSNNDNVNANSIVVSHCCNSDETIYLIGLNSFK